MFGQQQKPSGFGFSFPSSSSVFGQPQQQQQLQLQQPMMTTMQQPPQPQLPIDEQAALHQSIFGCCKFGDERDSILANLNFVQACWGTGKGFYNQTNPPLPYSPTNPLYRFKAVIYSFMYTQANEDGQVVLHLKKPLEKACQEEAALISGLQTMVGKPSIFFKVLQTKPLTEELTLMVLTADDRITLRRVLATDLASGLTQPQFQVQLDKLGVVSVYAKVRPSPQQLQAYLDNVPTGLDPRVWKKAQEDNPDPENMIPVPLVGPQALKDRIEAQKKENQQHYNRLKLIKDEITTMTNRQANMSAELQQLRNRNTALTHRLISVVGRMLILLKLEKPLEADELELKQKLQNLEQILNSPTHFKGRLNEIMNHIIRLNKTRMGNKPVTNYSLEASTLEQIKEFLMMQQEGITHLVENLKLSKEYVSKMNEDLVEFREMRM